MLDMTTPCATCPHRTGTKPLALQPHQRVDLPASTGAELLAKARDGRLAALAAKAARRAAAFQPIDAILIDPAFRVRVEALAARPVVTAGRHPIAAG